MEHVFCKTKLPTELLTGHTHDSFETLQQFVMSFQIKSLIPYDCDPPTEEHWCRPVTLPTDMIMNILVYENLFVLETTFFISPHMKFFNDEFHLE